MSNNTQFLLIHENRILGLMIFSLLAALHLGGNDTLAQSFLIVHFGFFLLWQPVVNKQSDFSGRQLLILCALLFVFIYWFNPWFNAFWSLLLLTMLTGRIFARGLTRASYGVAVIVVFLELTLNTTPQLFQLVALTSSAQTIVNTTLIVTPLTLLLFPVKDTIPKSVDFIRGFTVVLLTVFLCMSSVLISLTAQQPYIESLVISIIILSLFLLTMAFLWSPRAGFKGLAQLWEKYILDIGGPFEQWLSHVSTLEANTSLRPENFLSASLRYLMLQYWVCGVRWQTGSDDGMEGETSAYKVSVDDDKLNLVLYTTIPVGPSLLLHAKLLLSVLTFYYRAKLQEQTLIKQAHMQAIYETGSKLTHDVKNILQATRTMAQIINDNDAGMQEIVDTLRKQMPLLMQRLQTTLEKLRAPQHAELATNTNRGSLLHWWNQLQLRYTGRHIDFSSDVDKDDDIPVDILTTVVENLLDNARNKRLREPQLQIFVKLSSNAEATCLTVTDTGSAIDDAVSKHLFKEVISSHDGFGIGLYQSYELARAHGFQLAIADNEAGRVSFSVQRQPPSSGHVA